MLKVERKGEESLAMDFPKGEPKVFDSIDERLKRKLAKLLTIESYEEIKQVVQCNTTKKMLIEVSSVETIEKLNPSFPDLLKVEFPKDVECRGIIVTTNNVEKHSKYSSHDFMSRYFSFYIGHEDPVTGSAHCVLGNFFDIYRF